MNKESTIAGIVVSVVVTAILALLVMITIGLNNAMDSLGEHLDKIQESLDTPKIARTSVIHGYHYDLQNPKNSGLKMIRTARDGTMLVMPLAPPTPEKKDASPK